MGFRWGFLIAGDGSPFDCEGCSDKDKDGRNCSNALGLSDEARSVMEYTDGVKAELKDMGAKKVFSLGDLRLYECPLSHITEETAGLVRLCYLIDDSKRLLFGGGWAQQPFWLVEAYEVYRGELFRHYNNLNKL